MLALSIRILCSTFPKQFANFTSRMIIAIILATQIHVVNAQQENEVKSNVISLENSQQSDVKTEQKILSIYSEIEALKNVEVKVREGVVVLSGNVANDSQANQALDLANRLESVVTINDEIERTHNVEDNVKPLINEALSFVKDLPKVLPLFLLSFVTFVFISWLGHLLSNCKALWTKLAPNGFLADLLAQAVKIIFIVFAIVTALNLIGASGLIKTLLGGAGVIGIAVGFAIRDTLENYISSIMLSIRQPFRANDKVVINGYEGIVARLTSRATILMTPDGNHLRIPNSDVFKSVILNYTRNPERRFNFSLGVDAADDPVSAIKECVESLEKLDFILSEPKPIAIIDTVGDSNIVIKVMAWVNQNDTDFETARSLAIREAKNTLENKGFTLPEPIYRVRLDHVDAVLKASAAFQTAQSKDSALAIKEAGEQDKGASTDNKETPKSKKLTLAQSDSSENLDLAPDHFIADKAKLERSNLKETDLLDNKSPVE